jgi:hypothetical protein
MHEPLGFPCLWRVSEHSNKFQDEIAVTPGYFDNDETNMSIMMRYREKVDLKHAVSHGNPKSVRSRILLSAKAGSLVLSLLERFRPIPPTFYCYIKGISWNSRTFMSKRS